MLLSLSLVFALSPLFTLSTAIHTLTDKGSSHRSHTNLKKGSLVIS